MRTTLVHGSAVVLDLAALRARLAAPARPREGFVSGDAAAPRAPLRAASVLVPIVARPAELTVLLTRRTAHLRAHSGQVAFPGGRTEPSDVSPEATALRETREEIGLAEERIEPLARLAEYRTRTGYRVTPVVGLVRPPFALAPDPGEVDAVYEVPLSALLDPARHQLRSRAFEGRRVAYWAIEWRGIEIWGATAGMIVNLYRQLAWAAT